MDNPIRLRSTDGTEYTISGSMTIGRAPSCHIVIKHPEASRVHATIWEQGGVAYIQDEGSANGTFVNGRLIRKMVQLKHGDKVRIGESIFTLIIQSADAPYPGETALSLEPEAPEAGELSPPAGGIPAIKGRYLIIASCLILIVFVCVIVALLTVYYFLR